ncbi:MAG: AAA family ATPase, partial [Deltaproteobacteria bacterium]|nr:AAA family ATPase [Deltaproteobacteria bacterium]
MANGALPKRQTTNCNERQDATVMFADISGFTALSEKLDPEEVTDVMNRCFEKLESVVFAHGGVVDEYLGDCIKAVFGFSAANTNPTLHAVQASLEIRDALAEFNREQNLPAPLGIHIGLNSGVVMGVTLGGGEESDFSVMGDPVRFASRLEDASERGQIYVGPLTYERTRDAFEYKPLAPLQLDEHHQPEPIYELVAPLRTLRVKRQSERRLATVLFATVDGFEDLCQHLDADALTLTMHACFAALGNVVVEHGGVVDKYLGDGIMALFGVPNAIENAPRQALNAAIEIRKCVAQFIEVRQLPLTLTVHAGVNTGLVIAGEMGGRVKRDFTVMGDTVNLAARLKEAAEHGTIYVGPETYRYTRDDFGFRPLPPLRLKGKEQPVPAYELEAVTTRVHREVPDRNKRMVFSELVGRDAEAAALQTALECLLAGQGRIVSLIGEAGLGKSRLLSEVLTRAKQLDINVFLGRSLAVGQGQSFHPFVDLLRHWAGISEDAGETESLATLEPAVRAVLGEDADEVFPFITRLMGLHAAGLAAERLTGIEGEALEKLILKSTRQLLQAIAQRRPTVVVFEDLHWADQSSLNLLEWLLPLSSETALLFLHVFRPLFEETSERILRVCQERLPERHTEIRLERLDAAQSARLIRNLLDIDDLPAGVRDLIAAKAEGNPFYIEEVVRSLIDQGAVEHVDGRFRVTEKIGSVVIPGTIHDVIMTRVDRLDESARQLLQVASVIGRNFYHRILSEILGGDRPIDGDLGVLKEKQLIQERFRSNWEVDVGARDLSDDLEYLFKHALAQEAVYESVLLRTRREAHARVARAIEAVFERRLPEFYAPLAYHYSRAEQLEPAESYLCKAGEEAARSAASAEALQFFREAASIYDKLHGTTGGDSGHRAFLEKNLGLALLNTGKHTESIVHFDRSLEWLGEHVPKHLAGKAARWLLDMGAVLYRMYFHEGRRGAVPNLDHEREVFKLYYERGHAMVTSDPRRLFLEMATPLRRFHRVDPRLIEQGLAMYVSCATILTYSGMSFAISERALDVAKTLLNENNSRDLFTYRTMRFTCHYFNGDWSHAPWIEPDLVERALRLGMVWDVTMYLGIEADCLFRCGDFEAASSSLAKLVEIRDTYNYAYAGNNEEGERMLMLVEQRKLEEAVALADVHFATYDEATIRAYTMGEKAKAQILLGDRAGAVESLKRAAELIRQEGVMPPWHLSSPQRAQLLFDVTGLEAAATSSGRPGWGTLRRSAIRSARRAINSAEKVAKSRIEAYNLTARLWWVLGRHGRALQWWEKTFAEGRRMG